MSKILSSYSSRISFRDLKILIQRHRFGQSVKFQLKLKFFFYKILIFIRSIPAYRDPETVFTIADLCKKAREPQFLHVAVLWQSSPEDVGAMPALGDLEKMSDQIKVKQIEASRARGPSWARYLIQKEIYPCCF